MKYKHLINFIESYMDIKLYTYQKILLYLLYYKGIKTNPHNLIMRDATKQEQEGINNYIKCDLKVWLHRSEDNCNYGRK